MDTQIKELGALVKVEYIQHCNGVNLIASGSYLSAVSDSMHLEMDIESFLSRILTPFREDYDYIIETGPKLAYLFRIKNQIFATNLERGGSKFISIALFTITQYLCPINLPAIFFENIIISHTYLIPKPL